MLKIITRINNKIKTLQEKKLILRTFSRNSTHKNIIFLLPASKYPSGGDIVSYNQSETINKINYKGYQSEIFHPTNLKYSTDKFVHNTKIKRDLLFDIEKDFVIIPEVMVIRYAKQLIDTGLKYGIHVQNGYGMDVEIRAGIGHFKDLKNAYSHASIIIGNSNDTKENIKFVFPEYIDKIIHLPYVINKAKYQDIEHKKNIITYMPRKLEPHTKMLLFFLAEKLPKNWSIQSIHGVSEQEVYDIFYKSKIFLSFSEFEGIAMPPAMAAMSGNRVIGYTGEGNKEYFHLPCFEEIPCGDIKLFVEKLLNAVERYDKNQEILDIKSIESLQTMFSEERRLKKLKNMLDTIDLNLHN